MTTQKRFPANTSLDELTFLNDKKMNGELYAFLQVNSYPQKIGENEFITVVDKKNLPSQTDIAKMLGYDSPKTIRNHLKYLIERGYVIEDKDAKTYILPEMESIYFLIPLQTLQYLNHNCKEHIIKLYVYLGQRYKYALSQGRQYEFTLEELGNHIGIKVKNNTHAYGVINDALDLLCNSKLIDYCSYFDGKSQKKKLTHFSFEHQKKEG